MLKTIHIIFIFSSLISFVGRIALSQFNSSLLQTKLFKIAPHVIDTLLLLSGFMLVFHGGWLSAEYGWIVSKFIVLLCYVGLGVMAMRNRGGKRWAAFAGAILCFIYIFSIGITKQGFI